MRFPGFEGEWENEKSGILCESIVPGRNKPKNFEGDIPWITTPDIEQNGEILFSKKGLNISKEEAKKIGSKIVPANSIIISCVGELGLVAFTGKEIIINQQLHAFIPKERIDYKFLLYQLSRQKKYMDSVATKTAVPYMNKDNCNSIPIFFPNLIEQKKIASFLSLLDERISTQNKIIEQLETLIKGLSEKLFSQKIRFKEFKGEWQLKNLEEVCEFHKGSALSKSDIVKDGHLKCIHYGELFTKYKTVISDIVSQTNIEGFKSKTGDVLMPSSDVTPLGLAKASALLEDNVILGGDINILRPQSNINPIFLSYILNSEKKKIIELVSGTTVKHIYIKDLSVLKSFLKLRLSAP